MAKQFLVNIFSKKTDNFEGCDIATSSSQHFWSYCHWNYFWTVIVSKARSISDITRHCTSKVSLHRQASSQAWGLWKGCWIWRADSSSIYKFTVDTTYDTSYNLMWLTPAKRVATRIARVRKDKNPRHIDTLFYHNCDIFFSIRLTTPAFNDFNCHGYIYANSWRQWFFRQYYFQC